MYQSYSLPIWSNVSGPCARSARSTGKFFGGPQKVVKPPDLLFGDKDVVADMGPLLGKSLVSRQ